MSEGEWLEMTPHRAVKSGPKDVDESTDTYDTIDWLIKNIPNNNGRVGLYGMSYPGFYAAAGIIDAHPALKAASPQAPIADLFMGDDSYHNGAFMLAANFGFYSGFYPREGGPSLPKRPRAVRLRHARRLRLLSPPRPAGERGREAFQGQESVLDREHPEHHLQRLLEVALDSAAPEEHLAGGDDGRRLVRRGRSRGAAERLSRDREESAPNAGSKHNMIVMGPWPHGGWARSEGERLGNVTFATPTSAFYREKIEFPFFAHHLKDRPLDAPLPEAYVFETGVNRWRREESWPPKDATPTTFYLRAGGALSTDAPADAADKIRASTSS